jgi:ATP-dependent Clp protease ATP-binding subunit ClpA
LEGRIFERFTDQARRVVVLAMEEARRLNHLHIGTEHLLLGLLREPASVATEVLVSLGVSVEEVRVGVEERIGRGQTAPPDGHMPFTPRAKKALELSAREAKQLQHHYVGTEHLLLGLVGEGKGVAAQVLVRLGAEHGRVRERVLELSSGSVAAAGARARLVRMTVPEDLRELEEQIAQVRRQKQAAIDEGDFDTAAALHDREQALLVSKVQREWASTVGVDVQAVVEENHRLRGEVERLRELLRQHGVEPNGGGGTAPTA